MPVTDFIRPAALKAGADAYDAVRSNNAAAWALWDLLNGLAAQQKEGRSPEPDLSLVGTYIRLRMRCSTAELCRRGGACKEYPGDAEFTKAAQAARKELKAFAAGLKGVSPLTRQRRARAESILETARRRAIFPLLYGRATSPEPSPAGPGEERYRGLALAKKQGSAFTQPPWP